MVSRSKNRKPRTSKAKLADNMVAKPDASSATEPSGALKLIDMYAAAQAASRAENWEALLQLGRHAISDFPEHDREEASILLARARIWGLVKNGTIRHYSLTSEDCEELKTALRHLSAEEEQFHAAPEFFTYLEVLEGFWDDTADVIKHLIAACRETPAAHWLTSLRRRLYALKEFDPEHDVPGRDRALLQYPKPLKVLREVYEAVEQSGRLDVADRRILTVLQLELEVYDADPWDIDVVVSQIRALPSPSAQELADAGRSDPEFADRVHLTPDAWAFMVELAQTPPHQMSELLERYPSSFGCTPCDAIRAIAASLVAPPADAAALLVQGAEALFVDTGAWEVWLGTSLTMKTETGMEECNLGYRSLHRSADISSVLLHFFEGVADHHHAISELEALYFVQRAQAETVAIEPNDAEARYMPGLHRLCEASLLLQLVCSNVMPGPTQRLLALLGGLARTGEEGTDLPKAFYRWDDGVEELSPAEAPWLLNALRRLGAVRNELSKQAVEMWLAVMEDVFARLAKLEGPIREQVVVVARLFQSDLIEAGQTFRLGYLEQVAGDKNLALQHYLADLEDSDEAESPVVNNMRLLWAKTEEFPAVSQMVAALEAVSGTHRRKDLVQSLLNDAKARKTALEHDDQFQRTAVNRWPSLTQPARKLLGVLATIQRYSGFEELGQYAGMDEVWVSRHYSKLVETGMVLHPKEGGYVVNPYIKPLIEKESKHAVVGRIVRAQGTSAVKQVFNSQREFTIYQVMMQLCPNQLVFPNCSLQSIMSFDRMKSLVDDDDFNYYLRASVDIVVVSSTTYLPLLTIEVDSAWHETEKQQRNDVKKDRLFAAAGIPFMRLQPVGTPSEGTIRAQVAEHLDDLVRVLRADLPGYEQVRVLLNDLSAVGA
jgi:hypothetical protein